MNSDRLLAILHSNDLANEIESLTSEERHFLIKSDDFLCGLIISEEYHNEEVNEKIARLVRKLPNNKVDR